MENIIEYAGYKIKIQPDDNPESPRSWDNLGEFVSYHSSYSLGDVNRRGPAREDFAEYINEKFGILEQAGYSLDDSELARIEKWADKNLIILPVYLYGHSGITIRTRPFSCPWDSGQIGYIYVSLARVREEYSVKAVSQKIRARAAEVLESEIKILDQYITGEVYWYTVEDKDGNLVDSCGGYYGEHEESGLLSDAIGAIKWHIKRYAGHSESYDAALEEFNEAI